MTQVINAPRTARFASLSRTAAAEQILRDAALVMALTQKVKSEMTRPTVRPTATPRAAVLVG